MIPTLEYVYEKFDEFNALIFDSELPPIPVKLTRARTFLGKIQFRKKRSLFGRTVRYSDFVMRISTMFDLPEKEQEDVIIHEMIHYCILYKNLRDASAHGAIFRKYMSEINSQYRRHITIRHKTTSDLAASRLQVAREHRIYVSLLRTGEWGITVCAASNVARLSRLLPRYFNISKMGFFQSRDPFFNKFPRSRTPKLYHIKQDELELHLPDYRKLISVQAHAD